MHGFGYCVRDSRHVPAAVTTNDTRLHIGDNLRRRSGLLAAAQPKFIAMSGALSSAMQTSERHQVGVTAAMSPETSPPYSETTEYSGPN